MRPLVNCPLLVSPALAHPVTVKPIPERRRAPEAPSPEPSRQHGPKEIDRRERDASAEADQVVEQNSGGNGTAHARPLDLALRLGQRGRREPADAEAEGQRVANDKAVGGAAAAARVRDRAGAVGSAAVEHAAVARLDVLLGPTVQQHVHVGADVHVAQLQRAGQREDQRDVLLRRRLLAHHLDVLGRARGQAARQGRVAVDVELEQVEEGVADRGDGAVQLRLDAVVELERLARLVADGEGAPLDLVGGVLDVFARFAGQRQRR